MGIFDRVERPLAGAPTTSGASQWLAVKRFDLTDTGRLHVATASGLLDADFRMPSLDYSDLIQCARELCQSPARGKLMYRRAVFNLLVCIHDDHKKIILFCKMMKVDGICRQPMI